MEVILDVKNVPKAMNPTQDDVIVFNGKTWYLTSKASLMKEALEMIDKCQKELDKIKKENAQFKKEVAQQVRDLSELVKQMYEVK